MATAKVGVRKESLTASQAGMTRLREKGGASPNTLHELTNAYVTASRTPMQRGGTSWKFNYADPHLSKGGNAGLTKGLMSWGGMLYTFAAGGTAANLSSAINSGQQTTTSGTFVIPNVNQVSAVFTVASGSNFHLNQVIVIDDATNRLTFSIASIAGNNISVQTIALIKGATKATMGSGALVQGNPILILRHPSNSAATLSKIHYAKPFMGYPYVIAEFSDGLINHYWLQMPPVWTANTNYNANELVQPTSLNGFYYLAVQIANPPAWTPLLQHQIFDIVQPTIYSGLQFYAQTVVGGSGVTTTTTASFVIAAIGATQNITVASATGLAIGTIVSISPIFRPIFGTGQAIKAVVTNIVGLTVTIQIQSVVIGVVGGTMASGSVVSAVYARSGTTEPLWGTAGYIIDVSSSSPPATPSAPTAQPGTAAPGTSPGGRYSNLPVGNN